VSALRCTGSAVAALAGAGAALAQAPAFQTPGMPAQAYSPQEGRADASQASRFSSEFNPAFSFIVDAVGAYHEARSGDDGVELHMRVFELAANAWVDPNAWAYFVAAADEEELNVEEAAVFYTGLGGNSTLRVGRVFIDFGKQMQTHAHELRTLERPLVLRTYLGDEVKGDGVQWDHWIPAGESTVVRWSVGAFGNLLPETAEEIDPLTQAAPEVEARKDLGDLNFTARLTGFSDVGSNGTLQLGASARAIPGYGFTYEPTGAARTDLTSVVYGLDATYGWASDTGEERWTFGGELLASAGDNGSRIVDPNGIPGDGDESIAVLDDTELGYFAFGDYAWDRYRSAGLQVGRVGLADGSDGEASEVEVYYTRNLSEFHRLRLAVTRLESDVDDDALRVAVQYTATLGAHGHGINW
jgi:hypothetical protein